MTSNKTVKRFIANVFLMLGFFDDPEHLHRKAPMNPLTLVKRIQNINAKEAALGLSEDASWHAKYKDSAYVFVGGIPFDLTEGDLLAVFAQYVAFCFNLFIFYFSTFASLLTMSV